VAARQVDALIAHYEAMSGLEAAIDLLNVLENARARIQLAPLAGLMAPRPYPSLSRPDRRWIIEGAYWIAFSLTTPPARRCSGGSLCWRGQRFSRRP
jgi:hypothetical protein